MNKPLNHSHLEDKELEQIPSAEKTEYSIELHSFVLFVLRSHVKLII